MKLKTAIGILGLAVMLPVAVNATTIGLESGISFQSPEQLPNGPTQFDNTALLVNLDNNWAPGAVSYTNAAGGTSTTTTYYSTGTGYGYFDAVSLTFNLGDINWADVQTAEVAFYAQKGSYSNTSYEHYQLLDGAFNTTNENATPTAAGAIDVNTSGTYASNYTIGWLSAPLAAGSITDSSVEVTLRLWNIRVDQVVLNLTTSSPNTSSFAAVPEPSTLLLLGAGMLGLGIARRKKLS